MRRLKFTRSLGCALLVISASALTAAANEPTMQALGERLSATENMDTSHLQSRRRLLMQLDENLAKRMKDLQRELRDTMLKLNIDGSSPGRPASKEQEVTDLTRRQIELQLTVDSMKSELAVTREALKKGERIAAIEAEIDADPSIVAIKKVLAELEANYVRAKATQAKDDAVISSAKDQRDEARQLLEEQRGALRTDKVLALQRDLQMRTNKTEGILFTVNKNLDMAKETLGNLSNLTSSYLRAEDEEKSLWSRHLEIDEELDLINAVLQNRGDTSATRPAAAKSPADVTVIRMRYSF